MFIVLAVGGDQLASTDQRRSSFYAQRTRGYVRVVPADSLGLPSQSGVNVDTVYLIGEAGESAQHGSSNMVDILCV